MKKVRRFDELFRAHVGRVEGLDAIFVAEAN